MSILQQISMKGLAENYNYYVYDLADTRINDSFLIASSTPVTLLLTIVSYIYIVKVAGPRYMENRKPYNLKTLLVFYNLFQIIGCSYTCYLIFWSGWWSQFKLSVCHEVDYSVSPEGMAEVRGFYYYYLLKVIDLVETVFFVMRKKNNQVSLLHVYHHSVMLIIGWLGIKYLAGGATSFAVVLNSMVHVIMYTYYLLALGGPGIQRKLRFWKQSLTIMQMVQFTLLIIHSFGALTPNCNYPKGILYFFLVNVVLIYYLFYDFYKKAYTKKGKEL